MLDRLRRLWSQINAQLGVLNVSQRMAIGLCAALAVVSLLWLMQWSTTPEFVPLVTHDFDIGELTDAQQVLRGNGIPSEVHGTKLFVRASDRYNALRLVNEADALPDGSLFDMEAVVTDTNPFVSPEARAFRQTYAKGNELAKILTTSPAVRQARVMINPITKRRLGAASDVPTASVTVTLASGRTMSPEMVEGFSKLVAGAVAGLKPHNVSIIDGRTMQSYSLPHPDDITSFDVFSLIKRREEHYRKKILETLADIPGLRVAVTVDLDMTKKVTQNVKHDPPEPKEETESSTEQGGGAQPTEPGVQANLGQAVSAASPGHSNLTEKRTTINFEPLLSQTETIEQMPFAIKKVTAAVKIPRSFVVSVYNARQSTAGSDPKDGGLPLYDDPAFVAFRDAEVARIKASVERIVMAKSTDDVIVDIYPDLEWTAEGGVWSSAPGGVLLAEQGFDQTTTLTLLRTYGPQAGLAALALASLFLVSRTVGKSAEAVAQRTRSKSDAGEESEEEIAMTVGGGPVGEAEPSESLLAGREVDPAALRFQEIGHEVSRMVEKDPSGTAELIRRWIDAPDHGG